MNRRNCNVYRVIAKGVLYGFVKQIYIRNTHPSSVAVLGNTRITALNGYVKVEDFLSAIFF
jgi:hypothetical protein